MSRIMVVGNYVWPWYQEACCAALERHGCDVHRFGWFADFQHWRHGHVEPFYHSPWHRIQARLHAGPTVWRVERCLLQKAKLLRPDIIWFYNVRLIRPRIVARLKEMLPHTVLVQYANDNPFSPSAPPGLWRNFISSIAFFDTHFSYRLSNIADYQKHGAQTVHLLRSYFIPEVDYPVPQHSIPEHFKCDVVFAGHYEDDGRVEMLEAICDAGFRLNLFGGGWDAALSNLRPNSPLRCKFPVRPATNEDYRYAICGAKVALCFLSTLNRDTYTRRNFQIPAMRTAMLSQYTDDLANLFANGKEVVLFKSKEDLFDLIKYLISDDVFRDSVAVAGYNKVHNAGHDVDGRMREWLGLVQQA